VKGNLRGCPAIIVTGRSDAVLPVNHTSRPYVALNHIREENSRLRYYEVKGAHHVDSLNMLYRDKQNCRFPVSFVPLHVYYLKTLDLMVDHLKNGVSLPGSQVIRPENPEKNLPDIAPVPVEQDRIRFENNTLVIPE
jgi:hydroxybutyrate-dimer hydrolase